MNEGNVERSRSPGATFATSNASNTLRGRRGRKKPGVRPRHSVNRGPAQARSEIRIAIIDDHLLFAESLEIALSRERYTVRRVPIPGEGGSIASAWAAILRLRPDVALLDLDLGRTGDGIGLIAPLTAAGAEVIVVTGSADRGRWGECVHHGAVKILSKVRPLDDILRTVRQVIEGTPVMANDERTELLRIWHERRSERLDLQHRLALLTAREREVLGHLTLGRTVSEIAVLGTVSEATVRTQVKSILAKLEVSSQIGAVGIAHTAGWKSPVS
jgi:two-component system nitrate/nitrite response regulator NarL